MSDNKGFIIQGHRGVRELDGSDHIENTFPAFNEALKVGAEIELDLQLTSDNFFVIYHNENLKKNDFASLKKDQRIYEMTLEQCQNTPYKADPKLSPSSIADLVQSIEANYSSRPTLDFEIKFSMVLARSISAEEVAQRAVEQIIDHWPERHFRIRSFYPPIVSSIKKINSSIETVLLTWTGEHNYLKLLQQTNTEILAPLLNAISLGQVDSLRQKGFKVIPYAVQGHGPLDIKENTELYHHLFEHFDGWTSDSPRLVYEEARKKNIRTVSF